MRRTPISAMRSATSSRVLSRPSLPPYWSAAAPSWMTASRAAVATASAGTRSTAGMPPESEIMSGREAAANRSRTALLRTPDMQSAYRSCHRSNTIRAVPMLSTSPETTKPPPPDWARGHSRYHQSSFRSRPVSREAKPHSRDTGPGPTRFRRRLGAPWRRTSEGWLGDSRPLPSRPLCAIQPPARAAEVWRAL